MAILEKGSILFTGSISNLSAYRQKGTDKIIVRTKGGASKKKIKKSASCKAIRENGTDFGTCSKAGSNLRWALIYVKHLADYNITSTLNSISKIVQTYDKINIRGKREVLFAQHRHLLNGFSLNKRYPFDSIIRHPAQCTIDRATCSAVVQLPELIPGLNLFPPWKAPLYRFIISLGILTDNARKPAMQVTHRYVTRVYTDWHTAQIPFAAQEIAINIDKGYVDEKDQTMIVSIGIEMGMPLTEELITVVKNTGSAKILMVG